MRITPNTHLWQLTCLAKDTVLSLAFEWHELRPALETLLHRIKLASLRALAFGKVEVVHVG